MSIILKNGEVYYNGKIQKKDCLIDDYGRLTVADEIELEDMEVIDCSSSLIVPGLIDPHVHLREPGFTYKGTIKSETYSMAKGGFTKVFAMPNLNPVPDSVEHIKEELKCIKNDAVISVVPFGSITVNEEGRQLSDMDGLSEYTIGFSDDGKGIQDENMMREAMLKAKELDCVIVAHCEDESLIAKGGSIHDGKKAKEFNLVGISSESEYKQIERDVKIAKETGCQYHVCHVSTKESVDIIRKAKQNGANVSCEVTVHHLLLSEDDIKENDGRYKMNPPLRTEEDRLALIEGVKDGTIEMICTDHAPHSIEEKNKGFEGSMMGIIGSEFAFGLVYSKLVKTKILPLEKVLDCMSYNVANIFGVEGGELENFEKANLTILDLNHRDKITEKSIVSMGKSTPFINEYIHGITLMTVVDGQIVYRRDI